MKTAYMREVNICAISDIKTLESHFARMAEKGWMIDRIGAFTHRYRAIEPGKKQFYVDLLPQITAFDYPENEGARDYRRLCEESGWTFVTASRQLHVFCADHDAPAPLPIHTDHKIQAQIYLKACRKGEMLPNLFSVLVIAFLLFSQLSYNGIEVFLSNLLLFQMLGYLFFFAGYIWTAGYMVLWYLRTKKSAKLDLPMPTVGCRLALIRRRVFAVGAFAFIASLLAGVVLEILGGMPAGFLLIFVMPVMALGVGLWVRRQIDTRRRERKANIRLFIVSMVLMSVVFFGIMGVVAWRIIAVDNVLKAPDKRPAVTLHDIGIESPPEIGDTYAKGSVAVPVHYSCWEMNKEGNVHTEVYRSISESLTRGLYSRYVGELEKGYSDGRGTDGEITYLADDDAAFWGADEGVGAFSRTDYTVELILLRGKTILRLSFYAEDMNMETAGQAVRKLWDALED